MERDEAVAQIREIQRVMERTTLCTLLPGAPAIIGGCLALIGCAASRAWLGSFDFQSVLELPLSERRWFCGMWAAIAVVAIVQNLALMKQAAKRQGVSPMPRPARFAALSLTPSILVALVLTIKLLMDEQVRYVAPVWMMCYGAAVYAAGMFSVRLPRLLGLGFVVAGAIGLLLLPEHGIILTGLSFGLLHIVFGVLVIQRARRSGQ